MSVYRSFELETAKSRAQKILYFDPFRLEMLASYQVALQVWYNNIAHFNLDKEGLKFFKICCKRLDCPHYTINNIISEWTKCLGQLPKSIEHCIGRFIRKFIAETEKWIGYFYERLIPSCLEKYSIRRSDLYLCVWSYNGFMDFKNTAINMLSRSELSDAQKFAIMCYFCLEDEIKAYSVPPINIVVPATIDQDPALYYWICYLKGELYKIKKNYTPLRSTSSSLPIWYVYNRMVTITITKNGYAHEYFSNKLNVSAQLSEAMGILARGIIPELQRRFSNLSASQEYLLLSDITVIMMIISLNRLFSTSLAFRIWTHYQQFILAEEFFYFLNEYIFKNYSVANEEAMSLLVKIWDTAPSDHINYVISKRKFIRKTVLLENIVSPSALEFFYRWLSLETIIFRKEIIKSCAINFALHIEPLRLMKNLLDLCLPTSDDQLNYKIFVLNSKEIFNHCKSLLIQEKFHALKEKLEFYSPDVNFLQEYMKRLLDLHKSVKSQFIGDFRKWSKLNKFLNELFPNDSTPADMKNQFVLSYVADCQNDFPDMRGLEGKMQVVESMFQNEQLENIKRFLLNPFKKVFAEQEDNWWYFMENQFLDFVSWCWSQDEKSFSELKNSISVDTIFDEMIEFLEEDYILSGGFDQSYLFKFDKFSTWLLLDAKKAKKYKLDKLKAINRLNFVKCVVDQKDELNFDILLKWFFDGDEAAIRKFKNKKHRSK